ncbi:MAG: MerR family transcriptional regulator [Bdellovibrionales bacterium]|nr:MerR family transcriptional regulator [Bdellovibrionales bacterium]
MTALTIGKVAKLADVGIETIRFYEKQGLLAKPMRRPSGYRVYRDDDVSCLRFIRRAKLLGFTLKEIKELLSVRDGRKKNSATLTIAKQKVSDIEEKILSLQKMKAALEALTSSCDHSEAGDKCPLLTALEE